MAFYSATWTCYILALLHIHHYTSFFYTCTITCVPWHMYHCTCTIILIFYYYPCTVTHVMYYRYTCKYFSHLVSTANETLYVKGELDEVAKVGTDVVKCCDLIVQPASRLSLYTDSWVNMSMCSQSRHRVKAVVSPATA